MSIYYSELQINKVLKKRKKWREGWKQKYDDNYIVIKKWCVNDFPYKKCNL
jgi:hypothetical protein